VPLTLADRLTEFLDRAHFVHEWPLYPPPETWSPEGPRPRKTPTWMDAERRVHERWCPDRAGALPEPLVWLGSVRREILSQRLAHLEARGRTPRMCLYALSSLGEELAGSFAMARTYAAAEQWRVRGDQCIADRLGITDPMQRPGWRLVLHLIRTGHAVGVVALTHASISPHLHEHEAQLDLVGHNDGFVALATAETGGPR
jgi:hypothetical protein